MSLHHHRPTPTARVAHRLRRGDRVVAISDVTAHTLRIHGFGVYEHADGADTGPAEVAAVAAALRAANAVAADLEPLVDHIQRHASAEWAARARQRYRATRAAAQSAPLHDRARALLHHVHHGARVRLDDGRSIDAHRCWVMRADTFPRYATATRVVTITA